MAELLFLSHRVPYPPDKGEKIRAWHILKYLLGSHDVHLGCLADDAADLRQLDELRHLCASVGCFRVSPPLQKARALVRMRSGRPLTLDVFHNGALKHWVAQTLGGRPISRIFVFSSAMAGYVQGYHDCPRILDMVDIDSEKWRAYAPYHRWPMRALYAREADTLLALERQLVREFDSTLFVSEAEATKFLTLAPESENRIGWIDNGVDLDWWNAQPSGDAASQNCRHNCYWAGAGHQGFYSALRCRSGPASHRTRNPEQDLRGNGNGSTSGHNPGGIRRLTSHAGTGFARCEGPRRDCSLYY